MKRAYHYTVYPDNSSKEFKDACVVLETKIPELKKHKLLIDVDGSTIQMYSYADGKEVVLFDDYDVGAVFIESDIDLSEIYTDFWERESKLKQA